MKLFDTHAHVNDGRFDNDRDEMLQACFDAGVEYIMIPGVDRGTVESGLALAKQYDRLYAAVGTHILMSQKILQKKTTSSIRIKPLTTIRFALSVKSD